MAEDDKTNEMQCLVLMKPGFERSVRHLNYLHACGIVDCVSLFLRKVLVSRDHIFPFLRQSDAIPREWRLICPLNCFYFS